MSGGVDAVVEGTAETLDENVDDSDSTALEYMGSGEFNFSCELT